MPSALDMARTVLGQSEGKDRAALMDYLKTGGANLDPSTTAWCAAFVNASLAKAGYSGTGSNMARSFLKWGQAVEPDQIQPGDIGVYPRGSDPALGHTGIVESYDPATGQVKMISGNAGAGGSVEEGSYDTKSALGFRRGFDREQGPPAPPQDPQQAFIYNMWPLAVAQSQRTGVDARIILAQTIQETGWGKSAPNNNYFGVKGPSGGNQKTLEFINGRMQPVEASFRGYSDPSESFADYGNVLMGDRYKALREAKGLEAQAAALQASGYATDPNYGASILKIAQGIPEGGYPGVSAGAPASTGAPAGGATPGATPTAPAAKKSFGERFTAGLADTTLPATTAAPTGITDIPKAALAAAQPTTFGQPGVEGEDPRQKLAMAMARLNAGKLWV